MIRHCDNLLANWSFVLSATQHYPLYKFKTDINMVEKIVQQTKEILIQRNMVIGFKCQIAIIDYHRNNCFTLGKQQMISNRDLSK